jgi:subtilisin family serine protease
MNRLITTSLSALLLAACGGGGGGDPATTPSGTDGGSPRVLQAADGADVGADVVVMLQTGVSAAVVAQSYGASVIDQFGKRPIYRLRLAAGASLDSALASMQRDARVRFAEANAVSETPESRYSVVWAYGENATGYARQWAPQALALAQAHAWSTGVGVRVAVLDTGVDAAHPAFAGRLARDGSGRGLARDFVDADDDAAEAGGLADRGYGHGTHVAGLVLLAAPQAQLMPARVLDAQGRGNVWVLAEALMWAVDPDGDPRTDDGAHVVNISLGTSRATRLLNSAVELATCSDDDDDEDQDDYSDPGFDDDRERCNLHGGVVVMAAAGNGGSTSEVNYPAAEGAEGQLAITAGTEAGRLASFANTGAWVQLAAPGDRIISTFPGGGYAGLSGTSMATPLAAGVAALVLARNPDWKPVDVTKRLLDRSQALCDGGALRALHAWGAVADFVPADPACR